MTETLAGAPENGGIFLTATIGGRKYSISAEDVERVVTLPRGAISEVPFDTGGRVRGLFTDRGNVVALLRRTGLETDSDARGAPELTAVIMKCEGRGFALLVDRAETVSPERGGIRLDARRLYYGETDDEY